MKQSALLLLLWAVAAFPARAADPTLFVWIDERVRLDGFLRRSFLAEMAKGTGAFKAAVLFSSDTSRPSAGHVVVVVLKTTPPFRYPLALGLARVQGGRILPAIEIYLNPVMKSLPPNSAPGDLGRALGRVAAHELFHYTSQRSDHDALGLFSASFGPDHLVGSSDTVVAEK